MGSGYLARWRVRRSRTDMPVLLRSALRCRLLHTISMRLPLPGLRRDRFQLRGLRALLAPAVLSLGADAVVFFTTAVVFLAAAVVLFATAAIAGFGFVFARLAGAGARFFAAVVAEAVGRLDLGTGLALALRRAAANARRAQGVIASRESIASSGTDQ